MKVDGSLANLLQGISQQPPSNRLPGQCTDQLNAINDVVDGWKRRPPTEFIAELIAIAPNSRWHFYNTGIEQYVLCITPEGLLHIFDLAGTHYTAENASTALTELAFTDPEDLSLVTIGDYTIISNKSMLPAMDTGVMEYNTSSALVYLKDGGEYGRTYTITIDGVQRASYVTPGGSAPATEAAQTGTEYVAEQLRQDLETAYPTVALGAAVDSVSFDADGVATTFTVPFATTANFYRIRCNVYYADLDAGTPEYLYGTRDLSQGTPETSITVAGAPVGAGYNPHYDYFRVEFVLYASAAPSPYSIKRSGSILEIKRNYGTGLIDVSCTDDRGGQFAKIIQTEVAKPSDLPKYATPGQIVKVSGDGTKDKDDYYLKFVVESGSSVFGTAGIWRECSEPNLPRRFDPATMPHALIRLPDMTWLFTPIDGRNHTYSTGVFSVERWRYRASGSESTNPTPSFVGKPIVFVGTFQDRLFFLSDESAIFSATNSYFNFWNKTALTILDSDPVDMPSAGNSIVKLKQAAQHDKNLIIFSDRAQFVVPGNRELTPKSSMVLTTAYESDLRTSPVPAGSSLLFPISYGNYAGLREFVTSTASDTNSSQPITAHVPKLIKGAIRQMVVSSNFDVVLIRGTDGANKLYVYKYLWQDGERKQASWGVWSFHYPVDFMFIHEEYVYLVLRDPSDVLHLERIDLTDVAPNSMEYNILLDSRGYASAVANVLTLPYAIDDAAEFVVVQGDSCDYPGALVEYTKTGASEVTLEEEQAGSCYFGYRYNSVYVPTMPCIKDQSGSLINNANFILSKLYITFKNTGNFVVRVMNKHYEDYVVKYSGKVLGTLTSIIGKHSIGEGVFPVVVRKDAKHTEVEISSNTHLPLNLTTIEWEGDYVKTGRRL